MLIKTLNELRDEALRIATEHGFKDATVGEDFMLIVSEVAEALEAYREGNKPNEMVFEYKEEGRVFTSTQDISRNRILGKPVGIPSEMADIIIRVLHFCGKHDIDIDQAVRLKMAFNNSRPFKHGKIL